MVLGSSFTEPEGCRRQSRGVYHKHEKPSAVPDASHLGGSVQRMPKLTGWKRMVSMRVGDREARMMTIMSVPVERRAAVQRKRYTQVSSTLHGDRHAGCSLYSLRKRVLLCYGMILTRPYT